MPMHRDTKDGEREQKKRQHTTSKRKKWKRQPRGNLSPQRNRRNGAPKACLEEFKRIAGLGASSLYAHPLK